MKIYRLTNIDTNAHRYFQTLEGAVVAGNADLGRSRTATWAHSKTNFSAESPEGWQKNDGKTYLSIIPIEVH